MAAACIDRLDPLTNALHVAVTLGLPTPPPPKPTSRPSEQHCSPQAVSARVARARSDVDARYNSFARATGKQPKRTSSFTTQGQSFPRSTSIPGGANTHQPITRSGSLPPRCFRPDPVEHAEVTAIKDEQLRWMTRAISYGFDFEPSRRGSMGSAHSSEEPTSSSSRVRPRQHTPDPVEDQLRWLDEEMGV